MDQIFAGGYTALLQLAGSSSQRHQTRAQEMVKSLMEFGAPVNYQQKDTLYTPLHRASAQNNAAMCSLLLEGGANPKLVADGMTVKMQSKILNCANAIKASVALKSSIRS